MSHLAPSLIRAVSSAIAYTPAAMGATTADRIEQFLAANPAGPLVVAVGYASAFGLAWLQNRTAGRPVSVLIGDTRPAYWQKMSSGDRSMARTFLRRSDVEVHNWYRTGQSKDGRSEAHLKAWLVHDRTRVVAALVGSANLTHNGLYKNVEVMVEPASTDLTGIWANTHALWGKSWDAKDRLTRYLDGDFASTPTEGNPDRRQKSVRTSAGASSRATRKDPSRRTSGKRGARRKPPKSFSTAKPQRRRRFN